MSGDKFYQVLQFEEEKHDVFGVNRSDQVSVKDINFDNKKDITLDGGEQGNRLGHQSQSWGIYEYVDGAFLETSVITESLLLNAKNQEVLKDWT